MDRAAKIKKYETIAKLVKMFTKSKSSVKEIAAAFYQADIERQMEQDRKMKQNRRLTNMPSAVGDVQRILDFGK